MRPFRLAPVFALLGICAVSLTAVGCGGSDNDPPAPAVSPSPVATRSTFAGEYEGTWQVETARDGAVFERITLSGPAAVTVSADGTFTAVLANTTSFQYGVFTENSRTHTLRGTIRDSGYLSADVTVSETRNGTAVETTNSLTGSLVKPLVDGGRYRGTVGLTDSRVTIFGVLDVSRKN